MITATGGFRANSKTEQVSAHIRRLIEAGELRPGDRLLPEEKLAESLGLGLVTVRRGLRCLVDEGVIERFQGRGTFVSGRPVAPRPAATRTLSLVYPHSSNVARLDPFLGPVVDGITTGALESRLCLQLYPLAAGRELDEALADAAVAEQLRGGVIAVNYRLTPTDAARLTALGIPHVQIGPPTAEAIPAVNVDHFRGGFLAALHLLRAGCRHIGLLTGNLATQPYCREIIRGYATALESWAVPFRERLCGELQPGVSGGQMALGLLADHAPVDSIICYGDRTAIDALHALQQQGRRIPDDLAFVAYNDFVLVSSHDRPTITAIRQPVWELGHAALQLLLAQIAGQSSPVLTMLAPTLVERQSTAVPQAAKGVLP